VQKNYFYEKKNSYVDIYKRIIFIFKTRIVYLLKHKTESELNWLYPE